MKLMMLLNENNRLSNPIQMKGFVISVDQNNGTVYIFDKSTSKDGIKPGNEIIKLGKDYINFLQKLSQKKNTI